MIKLINQEKLKEVLKTAEIFAPERITEEHRNMTGEILMKWLEKQLKRLSRNRKRMIKIGEFEDIIYYSYLMRHIEDYFEEHNMDILDTTILQGEEYEDLLTAYPFEYNGKEYIATGGINGMHLIDKARYGKFFGFGKGKFREVNHYAKINAES